jgi:hypothetical protein
LRKKAPSDGGFRDWANELSAMLANRIGRLPPEKYRDRLTAAQGRTGYFAPRQEHRSEKNRSMFKEIQNEHPKRKTCSDVSRTDD